MPLTFTNKSTNQGRRKLGFYRSGLGLLPAGSYGGVEFGGLFVGKVRIVVSIGI